MRHIAFALTALLWAASAQASEYARQAVLGGETSAPGGWVEFCKTHPNECASRPRRVAVKMDSRTWGDLVQINRWANRHIRPITDENNYKTVELWTFPDNRYGDCEDYVIFKKRELRERGWPEGALLITQVYDYKGRSTHGVLTVVTEEGEYVLDNVRDEVLLWSQTGYLFQRRQDPENPNKWVEIRH